MAKKSMNALYSDVAIELEIPKIDLREWSNKMGGTHSISVGKDSDDEKISLSFRHKSTSSAYGDSDSVNFLYFGEDGMLSIDCNSHPDADPDTVCKVDGSPKLMSQFDYD